MEVKRKLRIISVILTIVILAVSLSACRLPSSTGPEDIGGEEYPVPGTTEQPSNVDIAATATVQAGQVGDNTGGDTNQPIAVTETSAPAAPAAPTNTPEPVQYVQATPGIPTQYVLKYGEFPFCIARRFDVNQYELLAINGLGLNSSTYVGMTLKIPQTGNNFDGNPALRAHPDTYTVKAGDTLEMIACKYGNISPDLIALQNGLEAPYTLTVGQKLTIP
jgi:LysM repeat protein